MTQPREPSDKPIATYADKLIQVRRVFTLYPDRVHVHAHWRFGGDFQNTVSLSSLSPEVRYIQIRYKIFKPAFLIFAIGASLAVLAIFASNRLTFSPLVVVGCIIGLLGLALSLYTRRRVLFARFETSQGKPGLDIACAGPEQAAFDPFIQRVRKQIRKQR